MEGHIVTVLLFSKVTCDFDIVHNFLLYIFFHISIIIIDVEKKVNRKKCFVKKDNRKRKTAEFINKYDKKQYNNIVFIIKK